jgi:hypothetical protein
MMIEGREPKDVSHFTRALLPSAFALLMASGCVPLPPEMLPPQAGPATPAASSYPDVEPNGITHTSLHFQMRGYNDRDLRNVAALAEDIYNKIGNDTGLYSYLAGQTYSLVVYKDQQEFQTKTKQPAWSRAIYAGSTMYTYPSPELGTHLAHQMTHLIFHSYMGDRGTGLHWLREGLAMQQEAARMTDYERVIYRTAQNNELRTDWQPFSQMTFFVGNDEEKRRQNAWYLQVESVVSYLMQQGTSLAFAAFLNQLKNGADFNQALSETYSARFRGIGDFERAWQASL